MEVKAAFAAGDEAALQLGGPAAAAVAADAGAALSFVFSRPALEQASAVLVRAAEFVLRRRQRREDVGVARRRAHARRLDAELAVAVVVGDVVAPVLRDLVHDAGEPFPLSLEVRLDALADGERFRLRRGRRLRLGRGRRGGSGEPARRFLARRGVFGRDEGGRGVFARRDDAGVAGDRGGDAAGEAGGEAGGEASSTGDEGGDGEGDRGSGMR